MNQIDIFHVGTRRLAKLSRFAFEPSNVALNVAIESRQRHPTAPAWCLRKSPHGTIRIVVLLWWNSQWLNRISNGIFEFSFQSQCRVQTFCRQRSQASFVPMDSAFEFLIRVERKSSKVSDFVPFLGIKHFRLIVVIFPMRARWRPIQESKLIESERKWVEDLTNECCRMSLLLSDLSICCQKRSGYCCYRADPLYPRRPFGLIQIRSETPKNQVKDQPCHEQYT